MTRGRAPLTAAWAERGGTEWLEHYWASWSAPHRDVIVKAVASVAPFDSLVEVGSHCGPNIRRLSARWPFARYVGIDANEAALSFGKTKAVRGEFERIGRDRTGAPVNVEFVPTRNFGLDVAAKLDADVFLSAYCLAYAAPSVVEELFLTLRDRKAVRALVLAEPLGTGALVNPDAPGLYSPIPEYHHDVLSLVGETWPGAKVRTYEVEPPADRLRTVLTVEVPA